MKYLTNIDFSQNQLLNAVLQKLATEPANPVAGQIYYNTALNTLRFYNGSVWKNASEMTGTDIVIAINGTSSVINIANLPSSVATAVANSHIHTNKAVLDNTTASFTTTYEALVNSATNSNTASTIVKRDASGNFSAGTITANLSGNSTTATSASKLTTARTITASGDATGSVSFDGSADATLSLTLANSGVIAGTYKSVTVDGKGRVTAGTNPTTLSGYGITDATPSSHVGTTGTAHGLVTTSVHGFMSSSDKSKLDGIAVNANNYSHPTSGVTAGTYKSVTVDVNGHITAGSNPTTLGGYGITDAVPSSHIGATGSVHGTVTSSVNGFMIASDKAKLDTVATNANYYIHPTSGVGAGTYRSLTVDANGHVTAGSNPTTLGGYGISDAVNKGGDSMSGFLTLSGEPTQPMHAATKQYVDNLALGLDVKRSVRAASTTNIPVKTAAATALTLTSVLTAIDGLTLAVGDRILLKDQSDATQNGIYVYTNSTLLTRANDTDSSIEVTPGMFTFVEEGVTNDNSGWVLTTNGSITVGTTALYFVQFSGAGQIMPGTGLSKSGNILGLSSSGVSAGTYTKTTVDVYGRVTAGSTLSASDIPTLDWSKIANTPTSYPANGGNADTIDGLHLKNLVKSQIISETDLNGLTIPGFYTGYGLPNAPDTGWWYVTVEAHGDGGNGGWYKQTVTAYGAGNSKPVGDTYIRLKTNDSTWSDWKRDWNGFNSGAGSGLDADMLDGLHTNTFSSANTIVNRNANGNIFGAYINSSRGLESSAAESYIYDTGDGYMRKKTVANVRAELGGSGKGLDADTLDGYHYSDLRKTAFVGSDAASSSGWYKVATQTMSGYGDTNVTFMVTSTYAVYESGILSLQMRSDNTSITCYTLEWLTRNGLNPSHYIIVVSGMTWTLYAYQPNPQYGRLCFEIISQSTIGTKDAGITLSDNTTKEATTPTATVTSTDGGYVSNSDMLDGYHATETAGAPNTVVLRTGNGYIMNNWFNSNRPAENSTAESYLYDTGDGYMRKKTVANVRAELGGSGSGFNADLLDGQEGSYYLNYNNLSNKPTIPTSLPANGGVAGALSGSDTRSTNYAPSDYMSGGSMYVGIASQRVEFKTISTIGLSSLMMGTFCQLITYIPWNDSSGGYPIQVAYGNSIPYYRIGISTSAWGSWSRLNDGGNADTLDGIDSTGFMKTSGGYVNGKLIVTGHCADDLSLGSGSPALEIQGSYPENGAAFMTFHRPNAFAANFGLDKNNNFSVGGWSMGANKYKIWHEGNDGSGSGLDSDTLDGMHASSFMRNDVISTIDISDTNYKIAYTTNVTNNSSAPSSDWWHIMYIPHRDNNGYGAQIAIPYHGSTGSFYFRTASGTTWSTWRNLAPQYGTTIPTSLGDGEVYYVYE